MTRVHVSDTAEAFNMGRFAGRNRYSCIRPSGVTFTKAAREAYQAGWEAGLGDHAINGQPLEAVRRFAITLSE